MGDCEGTGLGTRRYVPEKQGVLSRLSFGLHHRFSGCYKFGKGLEYMCVISMCQPVKADGYSNMFTFC